MKILNIEFFLEIHTVSKKQMLKSAKREAVIRVNMLYGQLLIVLSSFKDQGKSYNVSMLKYQQQISISNINKENSVDNIEVLLANLVIFVKRRSYSGVIRNYCLTYQVNQQIKGLLKRADVYLQRHLTTQNVCSHQLIIQYYNNGVLILQ